MIGWKNYWTAGYTVKGSSDVEVYRYCRSEEDAARRADEAAVDDIARLIELGIESEVTIWVRPWRTREVYEHDDKKVVQRTSTAREADGKAWA